MHIFGAGRAAFLEFLRNLTPAVLLASVSLMLWARLDFRRFDLSNWVVTGAFYICALVAITAFLANMWGYLDDAVVLPYGLDRAFKKLVQRRHSKLTSLRGISVLIWRKKPSVYLEVLVSVVVVYAGMFMGVITALSGAIAALENGIH